MKPFQIALMHWYASNKRDLPWRKTKDPYAIWLSEIMLQQTQVNTVIPYYNAFLQKYPDLKSVALASEQDLLHAWAGLGYYNRIRQFQKAAQKIINDYRGIIPETQNELLELPGLGDYTSSAIASIAFGEPKAVVDGNVMRVLARLHGYKGEIKSLISKNYFFKKAASLLNTANPGDFNQAMMELGATVCTPKNPSCLLCAVRKWCAAYKKGKPEQFPVNTKKPTYVDRQKLCFLFYFKNTWLLRQRESTEIMAGMWEFPLIEGDPSISWVKAYCSQNLGLMPKSIESLRIISHTIMNQRFKIVPFIIQFLKISHPHLHGKLQWVPSEHFKKVPLTTISRKVLRCRTDKNNIKVFT